MNRRLILYVGLGLLSAGVLFYVRWVETSADPPSQETITTDLNTVHYDTIGGRTSIEYFLGLSEADNVDMALATIGENWTDQDALMLLDASRFLSDRNVYRRTFRLLGEKTGKEFGGDRDAWYRWVWSMPYDPHPEYVAFKKRLMSRIDPRLGEYFDEGHPTTIRLDEVRWGGVVRDGIPPLKNPRTIAAEEAVYLADTDVVFGVQFGGHSRAYPQRILGWHEMVKDVVGGQSINGVYCTLCGSMIIYQTELDGKHYELGTSGFLYRSNKLMYDHPTKSLWSTLKGEPVIGPLVGKGIKLKPLHVVTTTWEQWRKDHPETDVLSLDTGFYRDYGEGNAYRRYFATDELMFTVPTLDTRLKNKTEIVAVRLSDSDPLAIDTHFLNDHRIYHDQIDGKKFVVLTDDSGANRVYESGTLRFIDWFDERTVTSDDGRRWSVAEDFLQSVDDQAEVIPRLPSHRAFWFGWHAAFPKTRLVQ